MPTAAVLYIADKQPSALSMDEGPPNSRLMGSFSYLAIKKHQGNGQVKPGVVHHSTFKKPWGGDRRAGAQRWNPPTHPAQKPFATLCTTQCWGMGAKETPAIRAELCNVTVRWIGNPWSWTHIIMRSAEPRRHQPHFPLFWETSGDSSLAEPSSSSCSSGSLYPHLCLTPSTVGCHSTGTSAPACPHNSWLCLQPDILRIFLSMFQH